MDHIRLKTTTSKSLQVNYQILILLSSQLSLKNQVKNKKTELN